MEVTKKNEIINNSTKRKHPAGLYVLFLTEMWERFSYYGMRALLIMYLATEVVRGGLGYDNSTASMIYGTFCGLVYFTPIIGGYLADTYLGQKKSNYHWWNYNGNWTIYFVFTSK